MYTLIEDFEDDARSVTSDAFAAGHEVVDEDDDDNDLLPEDLGEGPDESTDVNASDLVDETLDVESWSDDPVRMYLTQMGEIPLLTRQQEIALAKQIERHACAVPPQAAGMRLCDAGRLQGPAPGP